MKPKKIYCFQSYQRIVSTHFVATIFSTLFFFAQFEANYDSVACINFPRTKLELNIQCALGRVETKNDIFFIVWLARLGLPWWIIKKNIMQNVQFHIGATFISHSNATLL